MATALRYKTKARADENYFDKIKDAKVTPDRSSNARKVISILQSSKIDTKML